MSKFNPTLWSNELTAIIKARPEVLNEWVLVNRGFYRYACGIGGTNDWASITFKELDTRETKLARETRCGHAVGFKTKGEWRRYLTRDRIKALTYNKKGEPDWGAGSRGQTFNKVFCAKLRDLVEQYANGDWHVVDKYFERCTPDALDGREDKAEPVAPFAPAVA